MIKKLGYKNNRWHPNNFYYDWNKFIDTIEGKKHIADIQEKERKLLKNRSTRINYEEELKRTDLTQMQRVHYRKQLQKQKGE